MRLQTMYVDMRPMLTKWLGILTVLLFLMFFVASIRPDVLRAAAHAREMYEQTHKSGQLNFGYWDGCLRSTACVKSFFISWGAPLIIRALIVGGMVFGAACAVFGLLWRPEVIAMRDTRVNATKIEASRNTSPTAPRRLL